MDYSDFGAAVDIELPDEDRVVDADEDQLRGSLDERGADQGS